MKTCALEKLVDAKSGFATGENVDDGIVQIRMNNVTPEGHLDWSRIRRVPAPKKGIGGVLAEPGDVLFNATNSPELVGKSAYYFGLDEPVTFSNHFLRLRPREKLDGRYLAFWLTSQWSARRFEGMCRAWVNQASVSKDQLLALEIPLPPLAEQQRIAAILDQADVLRGKQRETLACLDDLSRSIFSQTFGDPVTNDRGWPRVKLGDVLSGIDGGWSPTCLDRPALEDEWGVLKLGAVTYGRYNETAQKALPPCVKPRPQVEVKIGDLLFTRKNTYDLVAACALVRETRPRLMLPDLIFRLRIADPNTVHPEYIHAMLSHPGQRKEVQQLASGAAGSMPNISKGRLVELRISLPPIALQMSFADKIRDIERLRKAVISSSAKHDKLFSSLQHRAFQGEL